jgi:Undecaprenyl-phosphate galactose phosphotransferase WbaP
VGTNRTDAMISTAELPPPKRLNSGVSGGSPDGNYLHITIFLCDLLAIIAATAVAAILTKTYGGIGLNEAIQPFTALTWIGLCAWFAACGLYGSRKPLSVELAYAAWGILVAALLLVAIPSGANAIDLVALAPWLIAFVSILLCRYLAKRALYVFGLWSVPTAVIGSRSQCDQLSKALSGDWYRGLGVKVRIPFDVADGRSVADRLLSFVERGCVRLVLIAPECPEADVMLVKRLSKKHNLDCEVVTLRSDLPLAFPVLDRLFGRDVLVVTKLRSPLVVRLTAWSKRCFDVVVSAMLLLISLPVLGVVACLVRRDGGAVFYSSARLGAGGKPFYALKFRTMAPDAEARLAELLTKDSAARDEWTTTFKLRDDPRITPIGRLLRRSSLDEVPQLVNVLRGEMSLVGPRPLLPEERETYGQAFELYCRCTPGITGPWQVSGRNSLDYQRRIELNSWYAHHGSLIVDLGILFRTVFVVFRGEGAV